MCVDVEISKTESELPMGIVMPCHLKTFFHRTLDRFFVCFLFLLFCLESTTLRCRFCHSRVIGSFGTAVPLDHPPARVMTVDFG